MINSRDIGNVFKIISDRIKSYEREEGESNYANTNRGCLNCKHYIRKEGYNQQWGMFQFYNCYCDKGIKEYYNDDNCNQYNQGDNKLIYMSEEEKSKLPH